MKAIYTIIFTIALFTGLQAQQIHRCYTDQYIDYLESQNAGFKESTRQIFEQAKALAQSPKTKSTQSSTDTVYRIPVVFHVVYKSNAENVADSLLKSQIRVLNEDYRRTNPDTINTRDEFKDRAADIGFEFFLATIDPDGNPTTGITRTSTTKSFNPGFFPNLDSLDNVKRTHAKGKDAWDTEKYLNIWICNTGGAVLGYAYPPSNAPNWDNGSFQADASLWGVVISYQVIGYANPLATGQLSIANKGRTATHEVGHYLGLRHIWGDAGGFFGGVDCDINKDDGIDDTPHMGSNSQNEGCDFSKNTCSNGESPDEPDMPENYMDYSTESCQNMFTKGQSDIMRSMGVLSRPGLLHAIVDESITLNIGDIVVVNGTDTFTITENTIIGLNPGDSIIFLNLNNGVHYTSNENLVINNSTEIGLTEDRLISDLGKNTSITNIAKANHNIVLFPNPVKDILYIKAKNNQKIDVLVLTDLNGKTILKAEINNGQVSLPNIANGMYLASIYSQNNLVSIQKISLNK